MSMDGTGVYVGISYSEYAQLCAARTSSVSTYTATGGSLSVAAGVPWPRAPLAASSLDTCDSHCSRLSALLCASL